MTLTQLRHLIAIADSGLNITLAAERVHATQPGLSKQLRQLEDELGFQLFVRKGKSLDAVTHAGEQVIERARIILAEATNIRAIAANLRNEAHGELRIATTHTQARFALPAAIAALNASFPQVSVHLEPTRDADVLARLEAGQVDLAIISSAGSAPAVGMAFAAYLATGDRHPARPSAGAARRRAHADRAGGLAAGQLRLLAAAGVVLAPRVRGGRAVTADRDDCR